MVKLHWLYGPAVVLALLVMALPPTRDALRHSSLPAWHFFDDMPIGCGQVWPREDPAAAAAAIDADWAYLAAAEWAQDDPSKQAALLDRAASDGLLDRDLAARRAGLLVGSATVDRKASEAVDPELLEAAERAVRELVADPAVSGYERLLQATVAAKRGRWDEVREALADVPQRDLRLPYVAVADGVARLLRQCGVPPLEAEVWARDGWWYRDLVAMRRMAREVAEQAFELRQAGREREAVEILMTLTRAGAHLRSGGGGDLPSLVGVAVEAIAVAAGEPKPVAPPEIRDTDGESRWRSDEQARRLAARLVALGMDEEARWVRAEVPIWFRVKQALRDERDGVLRQGLGPADRPLQKVIWWAILPFELFGFSMFFLILASLGGAVQGRVKWYLPWRRGQLAAVVLLTVPVPLSLAAWGAGTFGSPDRFEWFYDSPWPMMVFIGLATLAPVLIALCLGVIYGRRHVRRPGWRRFKVTIHVAGQAIIVPAIACHAVLFTIMVASPIPMAYHRQQAAEAMVGLAAHQARVVAEAEQGVTLAQSDR